MKSFRNRARALLEKQMLRWGMDSVHPEGSLLLRHGFRRHRPAGVTGSHVYTLGWRDRWIELHSQWAGICGGGRLGAVFVRPHRRLRPVSAGFGGGPLSTSPQPASPIDRDADGARLRGAVLELLEWIEEYESWAARLRLPSLPSRNRFQNSP